MRAGDRAAAVELPVDEGERDDVGDPDLEGGEQQRAVLVELPTSCPTS